MNKLVKWKKFFEIMEDLILNLKIILFGAL